MTETSHEGWFVTFEGPDGCGKTTQINLLGEQLHSLGYNVLQTREPGGTRIGDQIREVLHSLENKAMQPRTEILLYMASRAQVIEEVIRPALSQGDIVLADRYADSSLAYQGYGHRLDLDMVRQLVAFATSNLKPDQTIYLDIDPEEGLRRRQAGKEDGVEWNRLDDYALEFHRRVYTGYQELIATEPERWVVIDARRPIAAVQNDIQQAVLARLEKRKVQKT